MSIKPYGYMWAGIFIPANGSHPWHRKEGIALYAIQDTHRVVPVETLQRWRSGLISGNQAYCLVPPAEIQAIIEDKPEANPES